MRWSLISLLALAASPAAAAEPLCGALMALARDTARDGGTHRISVISVDSETVGCSRKDDVPLEVAFCTTAIHAMSLEFPNSYPRAILACLEAAGAAPTADWRPASSGFVDNRALYRVTARLKRNVSIDVQFEPDPNRQGSLEAHYGRYHLVVRRGAPPS